MALEDAPLFASYVCRGISSAKAAQLHQHKAKKGEDHDNKRQRVDANESTNTSTSSDIDLSEVSQQVLFTRIRNFEREMIALFIESTRVSTSRESIAQRACAQRCDWIGRFRCDCAQSVVCDKETTASTTR